MSILLLVPVVGGALGGLYFVVPFWVKVIGSPDQNLYRLSEDVAPPSRAAGLAQP